MLSCDVWHIICDSNLKRFKGRYCSEETATPPSDNTIYNTPPCDNCM